MFNLSMVNFHINHRGHHHLNRHDDLSSERRGHHPVLRLASVNGIVVVRLKSLNNLKSLFDETVVRG